MVATAALSTEATIELIQDLGIKARALLAWPVADVQMMPTNESGVLIAVYPREWTTRDAAEMQTLSAKLTEATIRLEELRTIAALRIEARSDVFGAALRSIDRFKANRRRILKGRPRRRG